MLLTEIIFDSDPATNDVTHLLKNCTKKITAAHACASTRPTTPLYSNGTVKILPRGSTPSKPSISKDCIRRRYQEVRNLYSMVV